MYENRGPLVLVIAVILVVSLGSYFGLQTIASQTSSVTLQENEVLEVVTASRTHWDYGPGVFEFPTNFSEHKIKTRWWIYVGDLRGTLRDGSIVQLPRVWVGGEYPARASLTSQFWDDESHKTMVVSLATKQVVSSLTKLNKPDFDSGSREDINVIFGDLQKAFGKQLSQVGFNTMSIDKPQFGD